MRESMTIKMDVKENIKRIVADIIETDPAEIKDDQHFVKDLGMDSMMALEILASLEKKYKIVVPEDALPKFTTLEKTTKIIEEILNN